MNIDQLISFIYIERYKNFRKAAKKVYISQPSLTSRIKSLEKELGVQLFIRNKQSVELTPDGEVFLPYAIEIFNSYLNAKNSLGRKTSSLIIGSIISVSTSILPNAVYQFQKDNANLTVEIVTAKTKTMTKKLLDRECHIAITETVDHPEIMTETIFYDNVSLFVNQNHHFANMNRPVSLKEVSKEPLICFNSSSYYWTNILNSFKSLQLTPNIVFNIDSMEAAKTAITEEIGICFLPELSLEKDISDGYLCRVQIEANYNFRREISLSYLLDANEDIQRFSEFLLEALKK